MERRIALIGSVVAVLLLAANLAGVWPMELKDIATYVVHTGKRIGVAWDPVPGADHYVYRVRSLERDTLIKIDGQTEHTTTTPSFYFVVPFAGHFICEVKAVAGDDSSEWAISDRDDFASVDGSPRGWWIYGHIAPAGDIEINSQIKDAEP